MCLRASARLIIYFFHFAFHFGSAGILGSPIFGFVRFWYKNWCCFSAHVELPPPTRASLCPPPSFPALASGILDAGLRDWEGDIFVVLQHLFLDCATFAVRQLGLSGRGCVIYCLWWLSLERVRIHGRGMPLLFSSGTPSPVPPKSCFISAE